MNWFQRWLRQRRLIRLACLNIELDDATHNLGWTNTERRKILQGIAKLKIQLSMQDPDNGKVVQFVREKKQ